MDKKTALINLYFGEWPVWVPAFLQSCKYNPSIDWLLFTDGVVPQTSPDNVRFIPFSTADFNALASDKLGFDVHLSKPYKVCDFRPAFGVIFEDYVKSYDFWGHCDLDVIWGDIRQFITDDILNEYEIISARKGIMCGHFSLYRNKPEIATIFTRHPDYQHILLSPKCCAFDERGITKTIKSMAQAAEVSVYWPRLLFNFSNPPNDRPIIILTKNHIHWYWERGKLYEQVEQADEVKTEVMYLHFMTWKKSMRACYFQYPDNPPSFYISYSHVGLTIADASPSPLVSLVMLYRTTAPWLRRWFIQRSWRRTRRLLQSLLRATRIRNPMIRKKAQGVKLGQTSTFDRYRDDLVQMVGDGVAKKEMARRTGLSVQTVRKYLNRLDQT